MRELKKHSFSKVFDLQNSSRTNFYKNILFPKAKKETWSSSITTLPEVIDKKEFDKHSVLDRFNHQLQTSGLKTSHTLNPNFSWAGSDINEIKNNFELNKFILPIVQNNPPPSNKGKIIKIKFCTQLPTKHPQFVLFSNLPQYVKESYKRFIENKLRSKYNLSGVPINIYFRKKLLFF